MPSPRPPDDADLAAARPRPGRAALGLGALFIGASLGGLLALAWQHPLGMAVPVAALSLMALGGRLQERRRVQQLHQLALRRTRDDAAAVWADLVERTSAPMVALVVQALQRHLAHRCPEFPLRPDDRLLEDLGIDEDTLVMALGPQLALQAGRSLVDGPDNPWRGRVRCVADLVCCLHAQPVVRAARPAVALAGASSPL